MIDFRFYADGGEMYGFRCSGHSGYADAGSDIVCAAVTSAVRFCECAINDVLEMDVQVTVEHENAVVELIIPQDKRGDVSVTVILVTLRKLISRLCAEYPEYLFISIA